MKNSINQKPEEKNETKKSKKTSQYSTICFFISCILFYACSLLSFASISVAANDNDISGQPPILRNIAVLPFENISENPAAAKIIGELIKKELRDKGWIFITGDDVIEEFLAKRRIRYTGGITRVAVREMGKTLDVDAVLVGSINQFSDVNGNMNVGITVRLVNAIDGGIIWADTLSYTNREFVSLLGLGVITSIDALSSRVVKDIVKDVENNLFTKKKTDISPFEIEKAEVYPPTAKMGAKIGLAVKALSITDEMSEIKAVIDGREISLFKGENGEYEGYTTAPAAEGVYSVDVIAMDRTMSPFFFDAVAKITVDGTPPNVSLTANRKVFASQKNGYVTFTPKLLIYDDIDEWEMEILDGEGKRIRGDKGYGKLPKGLIWRGDTDKFARVSDGNYTYKFVVKDIAGNETVLSDSLLVKNVPPVFKVDVDKVENNLLFTFEYGKEENIKSWKLSILDKDGKTIKALEGTGELPEKLQYPVDDINALAFSVTATDYADNTANLTKSIPSILSKKTPFAKADTRDKLVEDF